MLVFKIIRLFFIYFLSLEKKKEHVESFVVFFNEFQLMVKCWFGARWFGFLESPKMKGIVT